jgi:hypothetical protein
VLHFVVDLCSVRDTILGVGVSGAGAMVRGVA